MKFEDTGLEDRQLWRDAFDLGFLVVAQATGGNMEKADDLYKSRVLATVNKMQETCDDVSEASVAVALMGQGTNALIRNPGLRESFDDDVMNIILAEGQLGLSQFGDMTEAMRDARRISMCEAIVIMEKQLIGQNTIDDNHESRLEMLGQMRQAFEAMHGRDERLDQEYVEKFDAAVDSMAALEKVRQGILKRKAEAAEKEAKKAEQAAAEPKDKPAEKKVEPKAKKKTTPHAKKDAAKKKKTAPKKKAAATKKKSAPKKQPANKDRKTTAGSRRKTATRKRKTKGPQAGK